MFSTTSQSKRCDGGEYRRASGEMVRRPFVIDAIVILPDRIHSLISFPSSRDCESIHFPKPV
ncbi:MAG: hypothetical protein NTW85_00520 [Methylococcales bacterium]|nr:hypothetical protein [Methylococcales bacterium]